MKFISKLLLLLLLLLLVSLGVVQPLELAYRYTA